MKEKPSFDFEKVYWEQNLTVAGIDEVGRGSFAGPVVAAAVIFPPFFKTTDKLLEKVNDSKLLSAKTREKLSEFLKTICEFSLSEVPVEVINAQGIGKATQNALCKAVENLQTNPDRVLVDGYWTQNAPFPGQGIIKGDRKSLSIAAASILAKVYRDSLMREADHKYIYYDFLTNKGYGTRKHCAALSKYGLSDWHRRSFNLTKYTK